MKKSRETVIVNETLLAIGQVYPKQVRAWRNQTGALRDEHNRLVRFGLTGSPDIIGIIKGGRFFGIELKTSTGRQSEAQKLFEAMVRDLGGIYILARSATEALSALGRAMVPDLPGITV